MHQNTDRFGREVGANGKQPHRQNVDRRRGRADTAVEPNAELGPGAIPRAHPRVMQRYAVGLFRTVGHQKSAIPGTEKGKPSRGNGVFLRVIGTQTDAEHWICSAGPNLDVRPIPETPIRQRDVDLASQPKTARVSVGRGQGQPQRVVNSERLDGIPPPGGKRCGWLPGRLRLVEAPLDRFRNALGDLGAHNGGGVQVLLEVAGEPQQ